MKDSFAHYSIKDFDKYNCLKLSFSFYFILLYLLKGYAIGLVSLSNFKDKVSVIQWFYPDSSMFYLSLLIGAPGLFLMFVIFQRKPEAANWIKQLWSRIYWVIITLVIVDTLIYWGLFILMQLGEFQFLMIQTLFAFLFTLYFMRSHRAKINRQEFPEKIPDEPKRKPINRDRPI